MLTVPRRLLPQVPIEDIREIRTGADARLHRQHFQLEEEYDNRWLALIYVLAGNYKTLHLIAPTHDAGGGR